MRGLVGGHFRRADKNKDRFVDSNEYWALYQRMDKNGKKRAYINNFKTA